IDADWFSGQVPDAHTPGVDNLRYYDFFAQLEELGLDAGEVEAYVLRRMSEGDYVYEDVPVFLDFLRYEIKPDRITLLTYGEKRFQKLKFNCAPSLKGLGFVATLEPKRDYFGGHLKESVGLVIDDKMIKGLPSNFRQFKLTREVTSVLFSGSFLDLQQNWEDYVVGLR
ncbi:hypothetical protein TM7_0304, partial [candidate division TM7 genomosp. GTL1]